jgi:hypothetical protein
MAIVHGCSSAPAERTGGTATGGTGAQGDGGAGADAGAVVVDPIDGGGGASSLPVDTGYAPPDGPKWEYFVEGQTKAFRDPALPSSVKDAFGGETATSVPTIVYPLANSMHPLNIGAITFQWRRANGSAKLVRIDATVDERVYQFYVPCEVGSCTYKMPRNEWLDLAWTERGKSVSFTVSETDGGGGPVGTSAPIELHFTPDPTIGALYYWATSAHGLKRVSMGDDEAALFVAPRTPANELSCGACHSLSRDGKVIAYTIQEERVGGDSAMAIVVASTTDVSNPHRKPVITASATGALDPTTEFGHKTALNPDGSLLLVNGAHYDRAPYAPYVQLQDTMTGAVLDSIVFSDKAADADPRFGPSKYPIHFEWSPDGRAVVFALDDWSQGGCHWSFMGESAIIATAEIKKDANGKPRIGAPKVLAQNAAGHTENYFYPTWSPDGQYVAFMADSDCSNDSARGVMRLVPVAGSPHVCPGPTCYELPTGVGHTYEQAIGSAKVSESTWPKFAPFAQGANKTLMFIAYSSRRDYGFLSYGSTNMWMFAVDVSKLPSDPSYAPLFLPFQNVDDGGLYPFWTEVLPCDVDPDGTCSGCVVGEKCVVNADRTLCSCRAETIR